MSKSLLFTEGPLQALEIRGYTFKSTPKGFCLGPRGKPMAYKIGPFSSIFVNDLMERSGLEGAATFRFAFEAKRYAVGDLSLGYPAIAEEMRRSGTSFVNADKKAIELFRSDELSELGMKMPCLYEIPYVRLEEVLITADGDDGLPALKVRGDDKPFYYLASLASVENPKGELSPEMKAMLAVRQYSYYYDAVGMRLAFSNTRSAYYGLPPNSTATRMQLLRTEIIPELCSLAVGRKAKPKKKKAEVKTAPLPREKNKSPEPKQAVSKDPQAAEEWQSTLKNFTEKPTETNFRKLLDDKSAWIAFSAIEDKSKVLGKNKFAIRNLRRPFVGIDNAKEGKILIELVQKNWTEDLHILTALLNWSNLTRWEQGKFYFKIQSEGKAKAKVGAAGQAEEPAKAGASQPEAVTAEN